MRKNTLNFIVDLAGLLAMLLMAFSGLLMRFVLPPRRGSGPHRTLWGWDRHDWGDLHFWAAVALGALLVLHVVLHWRWVCTTVVGFVRRGEAGAPATAGVRCLWGLAFAVLLVALVGGMLWFASSGVQVEADAGGGGRGGRGAPTWQPDR